MGLVAVLWLSFAENSSAMSQNGYLEDSSEYFSGVYMGSSFVRVSRGFCLHTSVPMAFATYLVQYWYWNSFGSYLAGGCDVLRGAADETGHWHALGVHMVV